MPLFIYILGLAVFAQGTSEFMLAGLIPGMAEDLQVSVAAAGLLTSAFAIGMVVGAPSMAIMSMGWQRRRALTFFLTVFTMVHVIGAVTKSFEILLITRIVAALANAGFLAVALSTAMSLVSVHMKGRATSVLLGGVTIACVVGVPGGAALGELWGWRSAFWAIVAVSVPALAAIVFMTVEAASDGPRPNVGRELASLRRRKLQVTLLLGALINGATFCSFTYMATTLTEVAGFDSRWIPLLLGLFGVGSFVGVGLGGRFADSRSTELLSYGLLALLGGWIVFAVGASTMALALTMLFVQGVLSFAVGSTLIAQVLYDADESPFLGGAFATTAFNVGAALGPAVGGLAIGSELGFRAPPWVSVVLVALAMVIGSATGSIGRRQASVRKGQ